MSDEDKTILIVIIDFILLIVSFSFGYFMGMDKK